MKEASYEDAVAVGQQLNLNKDEVWRIIRGTRYSSLTDLSMVVHNAFKSPSPYPPGEGDQKGP